MKRLLASTLFVLAAVVVPGSPAGAGGWAVSSLDEVPAPQAGEAVDVGWTVRQHGVQPVNLDGGDVGVVVRSPSGAERFFPAQQQGSTGHYMARVVFPEAGSSTWSIRQGLFAEQALGAITVAQPGAGAGAAAGGGEAAAAPAAATSEGAASGGNRGPVFVRYGFPVLAALLVAAAVADLATTRRRSRSAAPA